MSIISAIKEAQHDDQNLEDLAKLPQYLIMNMVQRGEIKEYMLTPILGKKAEMADEKAKMQAAQQLAAQGGAMPTVLEQNMGKIAQAENPAPPMPQQPMQQPMPQQQMAAAPMPQGPEDVGIASQATQPMSLAGGGIIAFEGGGDVDDDEEDRYDRYKKKAKSAADFSDISQMIANIGEGVGSGYSENRGVGIKADSRGAERGMEGDLESRLRAAIMQKESGGKRYDKAGNLITSSKGALGEMQVMPATAKDPGFGIKPAKDINDPNELGRVGNQYVGALLNKYQDPKLTMIAYNMGPTRTDKWLAAGADMSRLPKETQQYIRGVNLAEGGEVKHYAAGGYEDTQYDPVSGLPVSGYETYSERPAEREMPSEFFMDQPWQRKAAKEQGKKAATKPAARGKASPEEVEQFFSRYDNIPTKGNAPQIPQSPEGIKGLQAKADDENFNMMQYIKGREAKMDKAAEKDYAMAGLAAGLGMIASDSPYWNVGVGKGGQAGVQQLAQSQKMRAAQDKALGELYGEGAKLDIMSKARKDALAQAGSTKYASELDKVQSGRAALEKKYLDTPKYMQLAAMPQLVAKLRANPNDKDLLTKYNALQELQRDLESKLQRDLPNPNPALYGVAGGGGGYTPTRTQSAALSKYS